MPQYLRVPTFQMRLQLVICRVHLLLPVLEGATELMRLPIYPMERITMGSLSYRPVTQLELVQEARHRSRLTQPVSANP
jgi:hypothetical protein